MSQATDIVPARRTDLVVRDVGQSQYVVKHPRDGKYFRVGPVEHFLLHCLDGSSTYGDVCARFETQFEESLDVDELHEFIELMRGRDLLTAAAGATSGEAKAPTDDDEGDDLEPTRGKQSWLFFRKSLINPDRSLSALEPKLWWIFTPAFVLGAALVMLAALVVSVSNRADLLAHFSRMDARTAVAVWFTVVAVTVLHEFAHGLVCKHFGGEVREIGVLVIFFTPCLFCNVSDAWLMPKRSHRLWITFAGTFCDLCVWALAMFVWRLTDTHTLVNHLCWVLISVCSGRILININPFMRMDGYYLLTDLLEVPNLRSQARTYFAAHVRWLLWGASKPPSRKNGLPLLGYGFVIWAFALIFLNYIVFTVLHLVDKKSGLVSKVFTVTLVTYAIRRVFSGFSEGEFTQMLKNRRLRTTCWILLPIVVAAVLFAIPMKSTAHGEFDIRPGTRIEIHSPVAAFVRKVLVAEGSYVHAGQPIVELEVPDLASLIIRKEAEIRETTATLARLQSGTRPEVLEEQRQRVARAGEWKQLAVRDIEQAKVSLSQDLLKYDLELKQYGLEIEFQQSSLKRAEFLYRQGALAGEQLRSERKKIAMMESQLAQVQAQRRAREADGVRSSEAELARREKEVAESRAGLALLEAGSRPEEIEAENAKLSRLQEELKFLKGQAQLLVVAAPSDGLIVTPRMSEKIGQLADKGALVCVIEDPKTVEVEILVPEEEATGIKPQQGVSFKSRALCFDTFRATVERIAPTAAVEMGKKVNSVRVCCQVDNTDGRLKSGMTGVARIDRGVTSIGSLLLDRGMKLLRTEFWW
jgi:multidrug efflux pump subunit AcrA (membrane-fusion protein)